MIQYLGKQHMYTENKVFKEEKLGLRRKQVIQITQGVRSQGQELKTASPHRGRKPLPVTGV